MKPDDWDPEEDGEWEAPLIGKSSGLGSLCSLSLCSPNFVGVL